MRNAGEEYLRNNLPPAAFSYPLSDNEYLVGIPASKNLLPAFFEKARQTLSKKDYYQIATIMKNEEIHPEIKIKLDEMEKALLPSKASSDE